MDSTITKALNSFQNQLADIEIEREMKAYKEEIDESIEPIKPFDEIIKRQIIKKNQILPLIKKNIQLNLLLKKSGFRF
jgi:hypothetical protein